MPSELLSMGRKSIQVWGTAERIEMIPVRVHRLLLGGAHVASEGEMDRITLGLFLKAGLWRDQTLATMRLLVLA